MADEAEDLVDGETEEDGGGKRKKIILFVVLPILLLLGVGIGISDAGSIWLRTATNRRRISSKS
jgi:hypothetical protein